MLGFWTFLVGLVMGFALGALYALLGIRLRRVPVFSMKGWFCVCGIFNGESKEQLEQCRCCARSREWALKNQPQDMTNIAFLGETGK